MEKKSSTKISYVIPCYRSEKTLEAVVEEIRDTMTSLHEYAYEIIRSEERRVGRVWTWV